MVEIHIDATQLFNLVFYIIVAVVIVLISTSLPSPRSHIEQPDESWQKGVAILIRDYSFKQIHTARPCNRIKLMQWMRCVFK